MKPSRVGAKPLRVRGWTPFSRAWTTAVATKRPMKPSLKKAPTVGIHLARDSDRMAASTVIQMKQILNA